MGIEQPQTYVELPHGRSTSRPRSPQTDLSEVDKQISNEQLLDRVNSAIPEILDPTQQTFVNRKLQGDRIKTIAADVGVSERRGWAIYNWAIEKLRQVLRARGINEQDIQK